MATEIDPKLPSCEPQANRSELLAPFYWSKYGKNFLVIAVLFVALVAYHVYTSRPTAQAFSSLFFLAILAAAFYRLALAESRRDKTEQALRRSQALLNQAQAVGKFGGWEYDVATGQVFWTEEVYRILEVGPEYDPSNVAKDIEFCAPDVRAVITRAFERAVALGEPYDLEARFTGAKGTHKWVRTSARTEIVGGKVRRVIGDIQDITDRKVAEVRSGFLANHDRLTELPNRELFYDRLSQAISRAARRKECVAVFLLDLDDFKPINDNYGHAAGDVALIMVARRLKACLRNMDTVARLGGDEFAVVLGDVENPADSKTIAEKIIKSLSEPLKLIDTGECHIGVSIGIAIFPENGSEIDKLMSAADSAMYESKARGKNTYTFSSEGTHAEAAAEPWIALDASLMVGSPEIDQQHQRIANLLNNLNTAVKYADEPAELTARLFDEMVHYVRFHFQTEERLMDRQGYPDRIAHINAHQKLLDEVMYLRTKFIQGGELVVLQSLKDWLLLHIASSDRPLAEYLANPQEKALAASTPEFSIADR